MGNQLEKSKVEENIELIIRCAQTGEKITAKTIYEGKPVGRWLIQYRSQINNGYNLKISKETLNQLKNRGLLDKRIGSSIENKIQELIEWNQEYPFARAAGLSCDMQALERYTSSKEEYDKLLEKYKKMQDNYTYIRTRKSRGKLSKKHEKMCKEGNVRGVFGYPTVTVKLSSKYGLKLEKIDYILSKYGKMENFATAFMNDKLDDEDLMLFRENLNTFIDISKQGDIRYIKFLRYFANHMENSSIMEESNNEIKFFDSTKIPQLISRLTSRRAQIINMSFGFMDGKEYLRKEVAETFKVTMQAISFYIRKSFLQLIRHEKVNSIVFQGGEISQYKKQQKLTLNQKEKIKAILSRIYNSNLIFIPDEGFSQEPNDITPEELASIAEKIKTIREEQIQIEEPKKEVELKDKEFERKSYTPLEYIDFSVKAYNIFGRNGIKTLEQLRYKTEEEVSRLKGMGPKTLDEVKQKVRAIIPDDEEIFIKDIRQESEVLVDELMISDELFNILKRANINTVADLRDLTRFELENIEGIQENGFIESMRKELKRLEKIYGTRMTKLERLKHLKAEKEDEDALLRNKRQEASELLDSYEQLVNGTVRNNPEQR